MEPQLKAAPLTGSVHDKARCEQGTRDNDVAFYYMKRRRFSWAIIEAVANRRTVIGYICSTTLAQHLVDELNEVHGG